MKIKDLLDACQDMVNKGYGDRTVFVADDEDSPGCHELFYFFRTDPRNMRKYDKNGVIKDYGNSVVLGP